MPHRRGKTSKGSELRLSVPTNPFPLFVFGGRDAVGSVVYRRYCCPLPVLNFPIIWKSLEEKVRFLELFSASVGRTLVLFVDADGTRVRQCTEPDRCGRPGRTGAQVSVYECFFKKNETHVNLLC